MKKRKPKERIYVCHTYYHVYVACLKELTLPRAMRGKADLVLSTMSNDFGSLMERAEKSGLFEAVFMFEEKEEHAFPQLARYHEDHGNLVFNLFSRMIFTKLYGKLQQPYVPVDFKKYQDIYVFCDSDPIGYYLNYKKIHYHAVEDGLDCICYYDTARYDNRGHFGLKAFLAAHNLIFIQNGLYVECGTEQSPAACTQRYFSFIGELGCFGYYVDYSACTSEIVSDTLCDGCRTLDNLYTFYSLHFG